MPLRVVSNEDNVLTLRLVGFATGDDEVTVIPAQPGPLVSFPCLDPFQTTYKYYRKSSLPGNRVFSQTQTRSLWILQCK